MGANQAQENDRGGFVVKLQIEVPNSERTRTTVKVLAEDGSVMFTDRENLFQAAGREELAQRLAKKLKLKLKEVRKKLEAAWTEAVNKKEQEKKAKGDSKNQLACTYFV